MRLDSRHCKQKSAGNYAAISSKSKPSWDTRKPSSRMSISRSWWVGWPRSRSYHSTTALPLRSKPITHPGSPATAIFRYTLEPIWMLAAMLRYWQAFSNLSSFIFVNTCRKGKDGYCLHPHSRHTFRCSRRLCRSI